MKPTITRNQCGRTNQDVLFSKTLGQIEDYYREGRINQSEYELYTHYWNKTHDKPCNCAFDLIEASKADDLYIWLCQLPYNACFDFFCAFGWPEGHSYCMGSQNYYNYTGFKGLQREMGFMQDKINAIIENRHNR
jgi:hypothetical protein